MWSEDLDKKIQLAAESKDPAYDEKAWDKMESLLDTHLPQEKKRRRILFLLFIFLLTGSSVFVMLRQSRQNKTITTGTKNETPANTATNPDPVKKEMTEPEKQSESIKEKQLIPPTAEPSAAPASTDKTSVPLPVAVAKDQLTISEQKKTNADRYKLSGKQQPVASGNTTKQKNSNIASVSLFPSAVDKQPLAAPKSSQLPGKDEVLQPTKTITTGTDSSPRLTISGKNTEPDSLSITIAKKAATTDSSKASPETPVVLQKKNTTTAKPGKLALTLSFGPDISSVGIDNPGKWKTQFGLGLSYELNKRLTLRTGFYASRKIYTADSADYHPPKDFLAYYNNLQKIDANCMVYEIPITVMYNFSSSTRHNWFASAGFSSYLMKTEDYKYYYKNSWGQPQSFKKSLDNENKHLFSIFHLSGGYQYRFSDRFSLMAEPYVKLPLSGVGFGKVKLSSGGLLFTATLKPFAGKK